MLVQLDSLRTYPAVSDGERSGRLLLHAWWLDIGCAEVYEFDRAVGDYVMLDDARIARRLEEVDARGRRP